MPGRSCVAFVLLIISQSNVVSEISPGASISKRAREITRGTPEPSPALNQQYKSPHSTRPIESQRRSDVIPQKTTEAALWALPLAVLAPVRMQECQEDGLVLSNGVPQTRV